MCSGSEAGSYLRLIDFVYHSTLSLGVIKKKKKGWGVLDVCALEEGEVLELRAVPGRHSSQFKNNHSTEMCSGAEAGSYLRLVDSCITQVKAQGPSRTCNESKEEEAFARQREGVGST